jgi:hypothetical protein
VVRNRTSEGALAVAEQLALQQLVWQAAAILGDEGLPGARASSSLPVPDSPVMSTGMSQGAMRVSWSQMPSMGLSGPRMTASRHQLRRWLAGSGASC